MIENPCDLSDADLREWAYHEEVELMEQDEDLLLHDVRYMPVLLECARDPDCPKSVYIFNIISYCGQLRLLHKVLEETRSLSETISTQLLLPGGERLAELQYLISAAELLASPREISIEAADRLAYDLLVRNTARTLSFTGSVVDEYREYTYAAPYQNYLYVSPEQGVWV